MSARPQTTATGIGGAWRHARRAISDYPAIVLTAILVLLIVGTNLVSPGFAAPDHLSTVLLYAAPLGVLAAGQTLVLLTGGIDLSVAGTATAAAYLLAGFGGLGPGPAIALALLLGLAIGLVNGVGIGIFGVQPLIMTLGVSGVIVGALALAAQSFTNGVPTIPDAVRQLGSGTVFGVVPENLFVWAPLALLVIFGLRNSGFGRMVYAVGDNPLACRLAGVRVWQVLVATYALCGLLGAVAGILFVGSTNAADQNLAAPYLLPSVAAAVIGGVSILGGSGGYGGAILGALILTVLGSLLNILNAPEATKQMLYGVIILALATIYTRTSGGES